MNQPRFDHDPIERQTIVQAQNAIAGLIPEIEQLAWKFFQIVRALDVPLNDKSFLDEGPQPGHLRWRVALGAMSTYSELIDLIPFARESATFAAADPLRER